MCTISINNPWKRNNCDITSSQLVAYDWRTSWFCHSDSNLLQSHTKVLKDNMLKVPVKTVWCIISAFKSNNFLQLRNTTLVNCLHLTKPSLKLYALSSSAFGSQAFNSYPVEILIRIQVSYCASGWTCTYYTLKRNLRRKSIQQTPYLSSLLIWSPKPTVSTTVSFSFTLLSFKSTKGNWQKTIISTGYLIRDFIVNAPTEWKCTPYIFHVNVSGFQELMSKYLYS